MNKKDIKIGEKYYNAFTGSPEHKDKIRPGLYIVKTIDFKESTKQFKLKKIKKIFDFFHDEISFGFSEYTDIYYTESEYIHDSMENVFIYLKKYNITRRKVVERIFQ